jgi:serine/threonine-protein kinase RsbW
MTIHAKTKSDLCIIRTLAEVPVLLGSLLEVLRGLDYSDRDRFCVHVSLEEVIVNAIRHGNREDPLKTVQIRYHATPQQFTIEIQDEGAGFDPDSVPDPLDAENLERPGGRGIYIAQHCMTWVKYNDVGNCVTLCKVQAVSEKLLLGGPDCLRYGSAVP